jgi:hypothetical protein
VRRQRLAFLGRPSWAGGVNGDSANRQRGRAEAPSGHLFVPHSAGRIQEAVWNASFSLRRRGDDECWPWMILANTVVLATSGQYQLQETRRAPISLSWPPASLAPQPEESGARDYIVGKEIILA